MLMEQPKQTKPNQKNEELNEQQLKMILLVQSLGDMPESHIRGE